MKNLLLTGATGFLGARLAELIRKEYSDKYNLILLSSKKISGYTCLPHNNYTFDTSLFYEFGIMKIDIVLHAGWFVAKNTDDNKDIEKNFSPVINTCHLLANLPNIPEKIVFCSSTDVYGGTGTNEEYSLGCLFDEDSPISLVSLYGLSKYNTELFITDWAKRNNTQCQILRLGPLYGVGDLRSSFLIGAMLKRAASGENLVLYADKRMKRNLLYVDDACRFIINGIELKTNPGVINVVSENNPTMEELTATICNAVGNTIICETKDLDYKGKDLAYDASKCVRYLGKETVSLLEGVKMTIEWNKEYYQL